MRRILGLALVLTACGPQQDMTADSYWSERNLTGEDFKNFQDNAGDDVGEAANNSRKYLSSKGFSKEENQQELIATRDNAGEYANDKRKGLYRKGIQEMRHGDAEENSQVIQKNKELDSKNAQQDARVDALIEELEITIDMLSGVDNDNAQALQALAGVVEDNKTEGAKALAKLAADMGAAMSAEAAARSQAVSDLGIELEDSIQDEAAAREAGDEEAADALDREKRARRRLSARTYRSFRYLNNLINENANTIEDIQDQLEEIEEELEDSCRVEEGYRVRVQVYGITHCHYSYYYHCHYDYRWENINIPSVECGEDD
ncbi:hypothetical protein OAF54_00145 [bacterium]|nr:hypothetical protein [bacterium]